MASKEEIRQVVAAEMHRLAPDIARAVLESVHPVNGKFIRDIIFDAREFAFQAQNEFRGTNIVPRIEGKVDELRDAVRPSGQT